jgi:hypothetical protein
LNRIEFFKYFCRILTPEEAQAFRLKFNPTFYNGTYSGAYKRRRGINDHRLTPAKIPLPNDKRSSFRRFALAIFIAVVILTSVAIFGYLAFGPEIQKILERFDFSAFYASMTGGKLFSDLITHSKKGD